MSYLEAPIFLHETLLCHLKGLSGSSVYLVRSATNTVFVRKIGTTLESSCRLEQQCHKIQTFQKYHWVAVTSVPILQTGYYNNCFFMDLEYIQGLDLIEYLAVVDISQLKHLSQRLGNFLVEMAQLPALEKVPQNVTQVFYDKVLALIEKCPWLPDKIKVDLFLNIKQISPFMEAKSSLCHGDFTFENILIDQNEKIYLIDHLDSFCPHYWQDISKLHQDLSGEWFRFRRPGISVPKYTLSYLSDSILQYVYQFDASYRSVHYGLLALVFARILPYAINQETREFALSRLSYYLDRSLNQ